MRKRMGPLRMLALAAGAVAMTLAASACGSDSGDPAEPAATTSSGTPHSSHSGSPPPTQPLRAGERFVNLTMPAPYTPSQPSGGTDEYRCMIIDPHLTKPAVLTGSQFQPQNVPIAHHAVVYAIPPADAAAARARDAETPGQGWTCFGDHNLETTEQTAWVGTWTPNATETLLNHDVGFHLQPGGLLIVQMHYNLLATDGRSAGSDQSSLRLRLTDGTAATKALDTLALGAPTELPCAPGESGPLCDRTTAIADVAERFGPEVGQDEAELVEFCNRGKPVPGNTQHCDYPVPQPMTVYAALGHMHLLGRSIKIELNPDTQKARTVLDVPAFNFDDQQLTPLATPIDVKPGDTIRVTCTHDATLRAKLPQLSKLPPRYVVWGDGTSDEMCLGLLTVNAKT